MGNTIANQMINRVFNERDSIMAIDRDGDGNISPAEWSIYLAELGDNFDRGDDIHNSQPLSDARTHNNTQPNSPKKQESGWSCLAYIIIIIISIIVLAIFTDTFKEMSWLLG